MIQAIKEKIQTKLPDIKKSLGFKNDLEAPRIVKVIISSGTGKAADKARNELIIDRLGKIAGQKPVARGAKKSIASFKVRQGDIVGVSVTLRGDRMYGFLNKLINTAIPRTRDFKGFATSSIDDMGNLTIGINEHTIFPETADEDIRDIFGLSVTIVTTARTKEAARALFEAMEFPFSKEG
ncbi:MAG: 50S ribosomal protein L5 [Candidatus Paceibacterota bacterium]